MRKILIATVILVFGILLSACDPVYETGTIKQGVQVDRKEYVENRVKEPYDITAVVTFINSLNESLDADKQLKNYETSYDEETGTVYAKTETTTIAFKMAEDGTVLFASCTGDPATKAVLSQDIAKVIMYGNESPVDILFGQIAEKQWLNSLNLGVVQQKLGASGDTTLDTNMPSWTVDTSGELNTSIGMPTLTNELERAGLKDLSDYYEMSTLPKFWVGIDESDMRAEMKKYTNCGEAFKNIVITDSTVAAPDLMNLLPDSVKDALVNKEIAHEKNQVDSNALPKLSAPELPNVQPTTPTLPNLLPPEE